MSTPTGCRLIATATATAQWLIEIYPLNPWIYGAPASVCAISTVCPKCSASNVATASR